MKSYYIILMTLCLVYIPCVVYSAYPTVDEARRLFSSEAVNSSEVSMDGEYIAFKNGMQECTDKDNAYEVETIIVNSITSIVVSVSTNYIDDSKGIGILRSRSEYFNSMEGVFRFLPNDKNLCLAIANYLGDIKVRPFRTNLLFTRLNVARYRVNTLTNSAGKVEKRFEAVKNNPAIREKMLQMRINNANNIVRDYRRSLLSLCSRSVKGCRGIMSDCEFTCFTNRIVVLSGATNAECDILFKHLYSR